MPVSVRNFGLLSSGKTARLYTLTNSHGASVSISDFGATVVSIIVPDGEGRLDDIALGFDDASGYERQTASIGISVGRCANRIAKGRLELNGMVYQLPVNNGENHLHGGMIGFGKRLWSAEIDGEALLMSYTSPSGEEGYPATLMARNRFSFGDDNALYIDYFAISDGDTVYNPTNHSYFNLGGHASGNAVCEKLMINAPEYTPIARDILPTGEVVSVLGTPYDFSKPTRISDRLQCADAGLSYGNGFDCNLILSHEQHRPLCLAATLTDERTRRAMDVFTTMPGIQLYTANYLDEPCGKSGAHYERCGAVCLETQFWPDAVSHAGFLSPILKGGATFSHTTVYKFYTMT
ncbi:MAG TPA: aldose epimerase family protein [Eubacteriales bacterium]|nr:aldose epimerase family protein [Clostridia bacterium]HRV73636.1 aldose epimerase family protein [Eubacteriales bacterium]